MKTLHAVVLAALVSSACTAVIGGWFAGAARRTTSAAPTVTTGAAHVARRPAHADARRSDLRATHPAARASTPATRWPHLGGIEQDFRAERVVPGWAGATEVAIRDAFASEEAIAMGVVVPLDAMIQCRSSTCRIEAIYASQGAADDAALLLQMDIADRLPEASTQTLPLHGGRVRLVIHARAARPGGQS
jgi:outer membrane murein-binding lipoprotein Lpp